METLAVLIPGFVVSMLICRWVTGEWRLIFSANLAMCLMLYESVIHLNMEKGTFDGPGPVYLWFRIPLQLFFIAWVYYWSVRKSSVTNKAEKHVAGPSYV